MERKDELMPENGLTLHFVRHGETYFNLYDRVQGWGNSPLTELGIADASRSGRGIKDVKFDAVYSSDLLRTISTAEILLQENEQTAEAMEIIALPEFREAFFGSFEGGYNDDAFMAVAEHLGYKTKAELLENTNFNERMDIFHEIDPYQHAENSIILHERLNRGLDKVIEAHAGKHAQVLIVAHGGTIQAIFENMFPDINVWPPLVNGSVSVAHYKEGQYELKRYGDISHFTDASG